MCVLVNTPHILLAYFPLKGRNRFMRCVLRSLPFLWHLFNQLISFHETKYEDYSTTISSFWFSTAMSVIICRHRFVMCDTSINYVWSWNSTLIDLQKIHCKGFKFVVCEIAWQVWNSFGFVIEIWNAVLFVSTFKHNDFAQLWGYIL
jgi:hypothetical protein